MEKILNNKKLLIIIGIIVILLIVVAIILIPKARNEVAMKSFVKYNVVEELYNDLEPNKFEENKEYVSKLYGYTYDMVLV